MNTYDAIMNRVSTRKYSDRPISDEDIRTILTAGMAGPTACNVRDWHFYVVRDRELLIRMAEGNGRAAELLKNAPLGIMVCADTDLSIKQVPEYWVINCSIACQNMILAATELGIGSCWLGTWPQNKVERQKEIMQLPENHIPHSIIAFGYPEDGDDFSTVGKGVYEEHKVDFI